MLVKSMRRDPGAYDYEKFVLVPDTRANPAPRGGGELAIRAFETGQGMTLEQVEAELNKPAEQLPAETIRWRFKDSPLKVTAERLDEHHSEYYDQLTDEQREAFVIVRKALLDIAAGRQ